MNIPDPLAAVREILGMPADIETAANKEPFPDGPGRFVIEGGTSVNHWASTEFIQFPNGDWYRVGQLIPTTEDEIRMRLFEGQKLERLIAASEADL